ncbi:MAG TPA: 3-dehydroquinate synthase, partial [Usitatibacter sp.]
MSASELRVELGDRGYPIHIGANLLDDAALYAPHVRDRLAAIVTNETVAPLYASRLEAALAAA